MSRSTLTVNGLRTPVLQSGDETSTEAIVFVHGNPGAIDDWVDLAGRVDFARTVVPELPGFGGADKPKDFDYTVGGYAAHLEATLHTLGITKAHLVLHDFGGPWGLAWAAAHPDQFASVCLINTGVLIDYTWHRYARIWRTPGLGEVFQRTATRSAFRTLLGRENPRLSRDQLDQIYEQGKAWPTKRAVLKLYRATPAEEMGAPRARLERLDRPALVVWGTDDAYLPLEQAEKQRLTFPRAEIHTVAGGGHWVMLEDPDRVAELVLPFLAAQTA